MHTNDLTEVRELVAQVLAGAEANERPDLVRRLRHVARVLAPGAGTPEPAAVGSAGRVVADALASLRIDLRTRQAMLSDPGRAARQAAELRHAESRLDRFAERSGDWPQVLGEGISATASDLEFDIRNRSRALLDDVTEMIESGAKTDVQLAEWLPGRLLQESQEVYGRLRTAVDSTVERVTGQIDLPGAAVRPDLPIMPPEQLVADCIRTPGKPGRSPLMGQLPALVMPIYGGMIIPIALPRILGLRLPFYLVVVLAIAGVLVLGGGALAAERERRRSRRKGETVTALRSTIDAFQLALGRQVRDGVRLAQQELRQHIGRVVAQQGARLTADAEAARAEVELSARAGDALSHVADDLVSIGRLRSQALELIASTRRPQTDKELMAG